MYLRGIELLIQVDEAVSRHLWIKRQQLIHHLFNPTLLHLRIIRSCNHIRLPRMPPIWYQKLVYKFFTSQVRPRLPRVEHVRPAFPLDKEVFNTLTQVDIMPGVHIIIQPSTCPSLLCFTVRYLRSIKNKYLLNIYGSLRMVSNRPWYTYRKRFGFAGKDQLHIFGKGH